MKVVHVINGLGLGGAQMMLVKLLSGMDRDAFDAEVVALAHTAPLGKRIEALGVPVRTIGMHPGRPDPWSVARLARWLAGADVVQTWQYHADLVGGLAARLAGHVSVAWNIRHGDHDRHGERILTRWVVRACAVLSHRVPARIVCCSEASRRVHADLGYAAARMVVIPNGFDVQAFRPDPDARSAVRVELGVASDTALVGLFARFDPQKDHRTFVEAAGAVVRSRDALHFVLCGDGVADGNRTLTGWIDDAGLRGRVHLLGRRADVPRLTAALDVACSSSAYGEGFPNVVGEAMAAGVPCVVTDVGDSAAIVGDTGAVVPRRDPRALALALGAILDADPDRRRSLGVAARRRVEHRWSLATVVDRYQRLYAEMRPRAA